MLKYFRYDAAVSRVIKHGDSPKIIFFLLLKKNVITLNKWLHSIFISISVSKQKLLSDLSIIYLFSVSSVCGSGRL